MAFQRDVKPFQDSMHEECGVFGIYSAEKRDLSRSVYYGLYALQHRGQEACGIALSSDNKILFHKGLGLVSEVFTEEALDKLPEADIAMGHVRYSTTGSDTANNVQPLVFNGKRGKFAIAHNGNITNAKKLRDAMLAENILFQTSLDTEIVGTLINKYSDGGYVEGIRKAAELLDGSFSMLIMTRTKLIALRDKNGIRPMVLGKIGLDDYVVASETTALDAVGATYVRDIEAGEMLVISSKGLQSTKWANEKKRFCIFEYVYFARPDSVLEGKSVYQARKESGRQLAINFPVEADIVSGVPDSANVAARGFAEASGIPFIEALAKNGYVGRTFIKPKQGMRESAVKIKLNAIKANVDGKRVVLVDDSIVRGTTSKQIVQMLRDAGAKEVHLRIASPAVKHPCFLGVDMQTYSQLIGAYRTTDEICEKIGADSLAYLTIDMLENACRSDLPSPCDFCTGCFTGEYPVKMDIKELDKQIFDD